MNYGCQVWNPHQRGKIDLLERVYIGPARWSCGSQWNPVTLSWSKSSEVCLTDLSWPTLLLRRHYLSIVGLYDIPRKCCPLNFTNCCTLSGTCTRKHALIILPSYSVNNLHIIDTLFCEDLFCGTPFLLMYYPYQLLKNSTSPSTFPFL